LPWDEPFFCVYMKKGNDMHTHSTPLSEIQTRIRALQEHLVREGLDGALIIHHTNLYYYSGTSQSAHLFVPSTGEAMLMVRKSFERARQESPLPVVLDVQSPKRIPALLREYGHGIATIGLELDIIPFNTYGYYAKIFSDTTLTDISRTVRQLRMIKSAYEVDLLLASAKVQDAVFAEVPAMLRAGMTELELASLFEAGMRRRGYSSGCKMRAFNQDFFMGNVNAGASGAVATYFDGPVGGTGASPANNPHGAGWKTIAPDEPIFIDYTCIIDGYTVDQTRMFCIGSMPEKMRVAYEAALSMQERLLAAIRPGVLCEDVYLQSLELAQSHGLADYFMGFGKDKVRFVGHGVGLELDELPIFAQGLKMPLEKGMVFALEPKFVFPDGAVGIENTHVVEEDGVRTLTGASQEIICVSGS